MDGAFAFASTPQEHERRRAHLAALLLVAVVAIAKDVSGLTDGSATYMMYVLAIAVSALWGFRAGVRGDAGGGPARGRPGAPGRRLRQAESLFALEGLGVAALVAAISRRVRDAEMQLAALQAANGELRGQARRGDLTLHALQHLEDMAPDAAVFLVSAQGLIVEWSRKRRADVRLYGRANRRFEHRGDMFRRRRHDRRSGAARGEVSRGAGASIRRAPSI